MNCWSSKSWWDGSRWISANSFGQRVRQVRKSLGLSQKELGTLSGLEPSDISHIESGRREPGLTNILRVCKGLGCKIDKLIIMDAFEIGEDI